MGQGVRKTGGLCRSGCLHRPQTGLGDQRRWVDSGCPPVGNMQVLKTSRERGWRLPEETLKLGVGEEISVTRGSHFAHA